MDTNQQYQVLYNNRLLAFQMERLNKTLEQVAAESGVSIGSVNAALAGQLGTLKRLRRVTDVLNINWEYITRTSLPESQYRRAVVEAAR